MVYLNPITTGPLIIVRLPDKRPRWSEVLKGLTGVMRRYGLRQKDIFTVENLLAGPPYHPINENYWREHDAKLLPKLEAAFAGSTKQFKSFDLYDWSDGEFKLVRRSQC